MKKKIFKRDMSGSKFYFTKWRHYFSLFIENNKTNFIWQKLKLYANTEIAFLEIAYFQASG